jgi:hypothetical protein
VGNVWKWTVAVALCGAACAKSGSSGTGDKKVIVLPPDAGDAGPVVDAGPEDAGPEDAGPPDAGPVDAGPDAGTVIFGQQGPWPTTNVTYGFSEGIQESPVVGVSTDEPIVQTDGGVSQNLWIATNWGLYLAKPGEKAMRRYDSRDGLHLPGNAVAYCADRFFADGDKSCRTGDAANPGISTIVGGGPNEVFVAYYGVHDWSDPHDGDWFDIWRHSGKLDRVRLNADGTLDVARMDLVSGNSPQFWHNRTVYRLVYDHFIHKHELYVGADHGVDKISPDKYFPPNKSWPFVDNLVWMSDHLHPGTCFHEWCTGDEGKDLQKMGEWRGVAIAPDGDLWVGGKWSAGKILYVAENSGLHADGSPDPQSGTGWFQRGGSAYQYSFGFQFCGTSGVVSFWENGWVQRSCSPFTGTPPVFWPPAPGEPVGISAVAVTPDGKSWWASGPFGSDPAYGLASFDGHAFKYFDPVRDAGMSERLVTDMVALPDGRLVLGSQSSGLTFWDPVKGTSLRLRSGQGIPDDAIYGLELDTMVKPPALHVATRGGAAVLRVLP